MALFDVSVVDANSQEQAAQMFHVISNQPTTNINFLSKQISINHQLNEQADGRNSDMSWLRSKTPLIRPGRRLRPEGLLWRKS
jgi:hypothetical protein